MCLSAACKTLLFAVLRSIRPELTSSPGLRGLLISAAQWSLPAARHRFRPDFRRAARPLDRRGRFRGRLSSACQCAQCDSPWSRLSALWLRLKGVGRPRRLSGGPDRALRRGAAGWGGRAGGIAIQSRARGPVIALKRDHQRLGPCTSDMSFVLHLDQACATFCRARMLGPVSVRDARGRHPCPMPSLPAVSPGAGSRLDVVGASGLECCTRPSRYGHG
jgi:hypothetical protein